MAHFKQTNKNYELFGQWLWHSRQRGCYRYQRTRVRVQSSASFIEQSIMLTVCRKGQNKAKEAGNGTLKHIYLHIYYQSISLPIYYRYIYLSFSLSLFLSLKVEMRAYVFLQNNGIRLWKDHSLPKIFLNGPFPACFC